MSLNSDYIHTDRELTQSINGMSILVNRYSTVKDETIKHGKVSFNVPAKLVHHLGTRTKVSVEHEVLSLYCDQVIRRVI